MEAAAAFFQFLQLGQLLEFLKGYPELGMVFGGLAVILAFLVNVGPLKRIQADTLVGKAIALSAVIVMLTGLAIFTTSLISKNVKEVFPNARPVQKSKVQPRPDLPGAGRPAPAPEPPAGG